VLRRLSGTSLSKTNRVAIAACLVDSGKVTLRRLTRETTPPVSVNQISALPVAFSSRLVPEVRRRLASM
jgi:hypothetical protein